MLQGQNHSVQATYNTTFRDVDSRGDLSILDCELIFYWSSCDDSLTKNKKKTDNLALINHTSVSRHSGYVYAKPHQSPQELNYQHVFMWISFSDT